MKKFSFLMLCIVLIFGACQKNLDVLSEEQTGLETNAKDILWMMKKVDRGITTKAVGLKDKFWNVGDTIRIKFLPGGSYNQQLEEAVKRYAQIWLDKTEADLFFKYVSPEDYADVKIGFDLDTRKISWATIGTDCKMVNQDTPSLNFYKLGIQDEEIIRREVLKGIGHVLGLGFENKHPDTPVRFNEMGELYLVSFLGLSQEEAMDLMQLYNRDLTNYSVYDPNSIMLLDIPSFALNPSKTLKVNTELSVIDIAFIQEVYKKPYLIRLITNKRFVNFEIDHTMDVDIDWGDGVVTTNVFEHNYVDSSEYTIDIRGDATALTKLVCRDNSISVLEVDENTALKILNCNKNNISNLNVQNLPGLIEIYCDTNRLTTLNFEKNPMLKILRCSDNQLASLNITSNKSLVELVCYHNSLTELDISHNLLLEDLNFPSNNVSSLDISKHISLVNLDCSANPLHQLDVSKNIDLKILVCNFNSLTSLDVSHNPNLEDVVCSDNQLKYLDLSNNKKLIGLVCYNNWITSLKIKTLSHLSYIKCNNNRLTSLDISENLNVYSLDCGSNQLNSLNVGKNANLKFIYCDNNPFLTNRDRLLEFAASLVPRTQEEKGSLYIQNSQGEQLIQNICEEKNWLILDTSGRPESFSSRSVFFREMPWRK